MGRAPRSPCFSLPEDGEALRRAPVPGTGSGTPVGPARLPLPQRPAAGGSPARRRGQGVEERTWAGGKEPGRTLSHPQGARAAAAMVTSASCLIHLKQQKGGCRLPARATAAWGCLQQPHVGFPERDSKPDILRLQNTQVSRAKNSCPRAPGRGKGACSLRGREGQPVASHPASCEAHCCCELQGFCPLAAPLPARCGLGLTGGFCLGGHGPGHSPVRHASACEQPSLLWDANESLRGSRELLERGGSRQWRAGRMKPMLFQDPSLSPAPHSHMQSEIIAWNLRSQQLLSISGSSGPSSRGPGDEMGSFCSLTSSRPGVRRWYWSPRGWVLFPSFPVPSQVRHLSPTCRPVGVEVLGRGGGGYRLRTRILEPGCLVQAPAEPLPGYVASDKLFNPAGPQSTDLYNGGKKSNLTW